MVVERKPPIWGCPDLLSSLSDHSGFLTVVPKTTAQSGPGGAQHSGHFACPVYAILILFPQSFNFNHHYNWKCCWHWQSVITITNIKVYHRAVYKSYSSIQINIIITIIIIIIDSSSLLLLLLILKFFIHKFDFWYIGGGGGIYFIILHIAIYKSYITIKLLIKFWIDFFRCTVY